ncbi:IS66 family transposase ISH10B [Spirochaetia bacterium]|nr:IS66 family transposase ISH10B [Spirochaetia bacterium]
MKGNKDKKDEKTQQADNKKDEKSQSEDGTVDEKPETEGGKKEGKPKKEDGKNTRGGQFGHKKQERKLFPPEQVDIVIEAKLTNCPNCGEALNAADDEIKVTQQIGVVEKPFTVTEYHQQTGYCPHCNTYHAAPLLQEAASGLFTITLIAFLAYLKGRCHTSYSALQDFFRDVLQITVSKGFLVKQIKKASAAMAKPHSILLNLLALEKHLHIDESGWKKNDARRWIWAFRAMKFAVFVIRNSRAEIVLEEVLGLAFKGIISCDFYGAYRKFKRLTGALLQFCWAHLIRQILFLKGLKDPDVVCYASNIIEQVAAMFVTIHKQDTMGQAQWQQAMHEHQKRIMQSVNDAVPDQHDAQLIAQRLITREADYFRFIDACIVPTNNPAELTVRQCVLDRVVTQGSRGEDGNNWHERFWTIFTTCGMQNISVMQYLKDCLKHHYGLTDSLPPLVEEKH